MANIPSPASIGEQSFGSPPQSAEIQATTERALASFGQAGQLLSETTLALMKKQAELATSGATSLMAGFHDWQNVHTPQEFLAAEASALRSGMEAATAGMRDINLILRSCGERMMELWLPAMPQNGPAKPQPRPAKQAAG